MKVAVELPDWVWGQLATRAQESGSTVADLIGDKVRELVRPKEPLAREKSRAPGVRRSFTAREDAEIRRLYESGVGYTAIGALFNVRAQTIHMKVSRWGLKGRGK